MACPWNGLHFLSRILCCQENSIARGGEISLFQQAVGPPAAIGRSGHETWPRRNAECSRMSYLTSIRGTCSVIHQTAQIARPQITTAHVETVRILRVFTSLVHHNVHDLSHHQYLLALHPGFFYTSCATHRNLLIIQLTAPGTH